MKINYSASTGNFYPIDIDYGDKLPSDVIEVPMDIYYAAMERPANCTFNITDGVLTIFEIPPSPFAERAAQYLSNARETRELILNRLAGIGMAALIQGNTATCTAVVAARQALLDITTCSSVTAAIAAEDYEALRTAIKGAYKAAALSVPAELRNAFNGFDK